MKRKRIVIDGTPMLHMRPLVVISGSFASNYGGGQVYVRSLVKELSGRGHEVMVFAWGGCDGGISGPWIREFQQDGVLVREVRVGRRAALRDGTRS